MTNIQDIPVLVVYFNRPDLLAQQINHLRSIRPKQLFFSGDSPRSTHPEDMGKCQQAAALIDMVDWECDIYRNTFDKNQGCRLAVSKGITWFFTHVEFGVILEDDCLVQPEFFEFILTHKPTFEASNNNIMHISTGAHITASNSQLPYHQNKIALVWGWATWRHQWGKFSLTQTYSDEVTITLDNVLKNKFRSKYLIHKYKAALAGDINSWAFVWNYTILKENGYCVTPNTSMVTNIGIYDQDATHTTSQLVDFNQPVTYHSIGDNYDLLTFKRIFKSNFRLFIWTVKNWLVG